jgi:hypothetical protein
MDHDTKTAGTPILSGATEASALVRRPGTKRGEPVEKLLVAGVVRDRAAKIRSIKR